MKQLIGLVMSAVTNTGDELIFECVDGRKFKFYHSQDCCENVRIEDVVGDLGDLVGEPILRADEEVSNGHPEGYVRPQYGYDDSFTWTFYKFATRKGYVDVRWLGESNGYYSESVDFMEIK